MLVMMRFCLPVYQTFTCCQASISARLRYQLKKARPCWCAARTAVRDLVVITIAAKAAHTQTHNHYWVVELTRLARRKEGD